MADSNDIRNDLLALLSGLKVNGERVETEIASRNSFCIRYAEGEPIFTVTVTYGGRLRNRRAAETQCENCCDTVGVEEVEVNEKQAAILGVSAATEPPNYRYHLCVNCREQIA